MSAPSPSLALLGFGEAAMAFAEEWSGDLRGSARVFDVKTGDPASAAGKCGDYARFGVAGAGSAAEAVRDADLIVSLVTADQAAAAAKSAAAAIKPGALYFDFNSVAPSTKQAAARVIESAGGRYADVAVLAPVRPAQLKVPLLVSGPHAEAACAALRGLGFAPEIVEGPVGRASIVKMIRSVMVKGLEALTAECFLAAHEAGVVEEVNASLGKSWPGVDWAAKADYNLERMIVHGERRAAEMDEVAATLDTLGIDSKMTRACAGKQRTIGALGLAAPDGLGAKSDAILERRANAA